MRAAYVHALSITDALCLHCRLSHRFSFNYLFLPFHLISIETSLIVLPKSWKQLLAWRERLRLQLRRRSFLTKRFISYEIRALACYFSLFQQLCISAKSSPSPALCIYCKNWKDLIRFSVCGLRDEDIKGNSRINLKAFLSVSRVSL